MNQAKVLPALCYLIAGTPFLYPQSPLPTIKSGGVVNAADYTPVFAPGMLITVFGDSLAAKNSSAADIPLPAVLDGTSVEVNGSAIPLFFVSPKQINAQMPFGILGDVRIRVRTPAGLSAETNVTVVPSAPKLFTRTMDGKGEPILVHAADFTFLSAASPALPGEFVVLWLTGLGEVSPSISAGRPGGDNGKNGPLNQVPAGTISIWLGDRQAPVVFAGLAPGWIGVYNRPMLRGVLDRLS